MAKQNTGFDAFNVADFPEKVEIIKKEKKKKLAENDGRARNGEIARILLLAMSTLSLKTEDGRKVIHRNKYFFNGKEYCGYGQMEPVPQMIQKEYGNLNHIYVLCTEDTLNETEFFDEEGQGWHVSAYEFFKKQLEGYPVEEPIQISTDDPHMGIAEVVEKLRNVKKEGKEIELYVDMHGGFRDVQLSLDAIISLLKIEGIKPQHTYSMRFNANNCSQIVETDKTMKLFDFVSGVNEFINFGRSKTLLEVLRDNKDTKLLNIVKEISDALNLCDIAKFEEGLDAFVELTKDGYYDSLPSASYLSIFIKNFQESYGPILNKDSRTIIEELKWAEKNDMIQQCLAIIESKTPEFIVTNLIEDVEIFVKGKRVSLEQYYVDETEKNKSEPYENTIINHWVYAINSGKKEDIIGKRVSVTYKDKKLNYVFSKEPGESLKKAIRLDAMIKKIRNRVMHVHGLAFKEGEDKELNKNLSAFRIVEGDSDFYLDIEMVRKLIRKYIENVKEIEIPKLKKTLTIDDKKVKQLRKEKSIAKNKSENSSKEISKKSIFKTNGIFDAEIVNITKKKNTILSLHGFENVKDCMIKGVLEGHQVGDVIKVKYLHNDGQYIFQYIEE